MTWTSRSNWRSSRARQPSTTCVPMNPRTMNAPDHDRDEPPLQDLAAWRGVLRGLQLVRVGLGLGLTCAIASCFCCLPIALLTAPWWQELLGWLTICLNLSAPIVI